MKIKLRDALVLIENSAAVFAVYALVICLNGSITVPILSYISKVNLTAVLLDQL